MAEAEAELRADPEAWARYQSERDAWLDADLPRSTDLTSTRRGLLGILAMITGIP